MRHSSTWANAGFISIDLRIHNGHDGHDPETDADDPLGTVYFEDLELVVPQGWTLYQKRLQLQKLEQDYQLVLRKLQQQTELLRRQLR